MIYPATWPTDADQHNAVILIRRLKARQEPRLLASGDIQLGRLTEKEGLWFVEHREAVWAALVGERCFTAGELDLIYGLSGELA